MSLGSELFKCDMCHKQVEEAKTFICQHSFCGSCLTDDFKICNSDASPTCSAKCQEGSQKHIDSRSSCEKEEGGLFCKKCDQSCCSICSERYNKIKIKKNQRVVETNLEELKSETTDRFYCVECEKVFNKDELILHQNHEIESETNFIKEKKFEWEGEIVKIKAYEVLEKSHMRECEKKLKDKKRKTIIYKDKVRSNYQELMEILKEKEELEYERINADLSRMQKEFLEHQIKIEIDILSLQKARSNIENKLKEINNGLPEGFENYSPIEQPKLNPHPAFEPHLSFQPISIEALTNLPSCIVPTEKYCIGKYEAEEKKELSMQNVHRYFQIDNNFIYAYSCDLKTILIYSLETLQLIKTLTKPNEIHFNFLHLLNVEERFYIIGKTFGFSNNDLTFDEKGVKLHDFTLPSKFSSFSKGEVGKVLIVCDKHVILYDLVTKKQESIIADIDYPEYCCSLGGGEYCMTVKIEGQYKLVKVVNEGIVKVVDVSVCHLSSNSSGLVCFVGDDNENMMHVMDRNLDVIFKFEINYSGDIIELNMDDAGNIHILNSSKHGYDTYKSYVKKYKMTTK